MQTICAKTCQRVVDSGVYDGYQQYAAAACRDEILIQKLFSSGSDSNPHVSNELREHDKMIGWTVWSGGQCPVDANAFVNVKLRDGITLECMLAGKLNWFNRSYDADIVAYAVCHPAEQEVERLRMQLVACGVAANQNTRDSIKDRITRDNPYWSASYDDVCRAVDREILYRERLESITDNVTANRWRSVLQKLLDHVERNTCEHEETHRGGTIWEICDCCGSRWADDEGGKPDFVWPDYVEEARKLLAALSGTDKA